MRVIAMGTERSDALLGYFADRNDSPIRQKLENGIMPS